MQDHQGVSHQDVDILQWEPHTLVQQATNAVESSTFGSEIVAMRIAVEMIEGLRCKLGMMGAPVDGPADVFCDNESAVKNTSRPESPLKEKHQAVSWHRILEACAGDALRMAKEDTKTNISDPFAKLLDGERLKELSSGCMWTDYVKRKKDIATDQQRCWSFQDKDGPWC